MPLNIITTMPALDDDGAATDRVVKLTLDLLNNGYGGIKTIIIEVPVDPDPDTLTGRVSMDEFSRGAQALQSQTDYELINDLPALEIVAKMDALNGSGVPGARDVIMTLDIFTPVGGSQVKTLIFDVPEGSGTDVQTARVSLDQFSRALQALQTQTDYELAYS